MSKDRDYNYPVGFGKPPQQTRFRKGQSGNPKGRPRGSKDFSTLVNNELEERVSAKENGRTKRITKRKVVAKQLVNSGVRGELAATKILLPLMERGEEANRQALVQSETPTAIPSISDFKKAIKYLEDGIDPSDDDDSSAKS